MDFEIIGDRLSEVVKGKRYIGTGLYRDLCEDGSDGIWKLERRGKDWVIKRQGQRKKVKPETAEEYWAKIFTQEMLKSLFKRKVTAKKIQSFITTDELKIEVEIDVGEDWVKVSLTEDPVSGEIIVGVVDSNVEDWIGKSSVLQLPSEFQHLDKHEKMELLQDVIQMTLFEAFVIFDVLKL